MYQDQVHCCTKNDASQVAGSLGAIQSLYLVACPQCSPALPCRLRSWLLDLTALQMRACMLPAIIERVESHT